MTDQILALTKKFVEIESTSVKKGNLQKIISIAKEELKDFTIEEFVEGGHPSILVYKRNERPSRFKVLLNGHLDVVPAQKKDFTPYEKDGRLYGRGTSDMKAGAAAIILVFKELAGAISYPLGLQLVTDEEIGGFYGTAHQIKYGVRADFVLAAEPTDMGINNKAKGIYWIKLNFKGVAAHGAYPWNGTNAIDEARKFLNKIIEIYQVPEKESWVTTINIAKIATSNEALNKVPDNCEVSLDVRYIPEDKERVLEDIKAELTDKDIMNIIQNEPPHTCDADNKYIKNLSESIKKTIGSEAKIIVKHGGSDVRHYNPVGCDGVTFGPVGSGLHSDNEWVDIKSVEEYCKILKDFLQSV